MLEFEGGESPDGLVFAAGVCSEGESDEDMEIRRYAITLLQGFFGKKGRELEVADYRSMLRSIFRHVHRHIAEEWQQQDRGLDLAMVIAESSMACAARSGSGELFLFHEGEARSLFTGSGKATALLGMGPGEEMQVEEMPLQPGDTLVLCSPAVAGVIRARDITLILRRASSPPKAGLFLSAIAERKGAEGSLTALIWEVPNYLGAAMLTDETPMEKPEEPVEAEEESPEGEVEHADQAKKHWLNLWRRRKS